MKPNSERYFNAISISFLIHGFGLGLYLFVPISLPSKLANGKFERKVISLHVESQIRSPLRSSPSKLKPKVDLDPNSGPTNLVQTATAPPLEGPASSAESGNINNDYLSDLRSQIERHLTYPAHLRKRRLQGRLNLVLVLSKSGHLDSIEVEKTSNYPDLDQFVIDSLKEISLPPVPQNQNLPAEKITLHIPIEFRLN
jgi:protein TonB